MILHVKMLSNGARVATLLVVTNLVLAGCVGGGSDGEMSDDEKLKKMSQGRASYGQGMGKSTAGTTTGQ